jgi:phospholipid/cholesterol/gamma-HCH transport system substrate-binding protein
MGRKLNIEIKVGMFVFMAIIGIIIFIFTQTKAGRLSGYEINVLFDYIGGLEVGSPVRVSGVRVGEVKKIEILYSQSPKVLVKLKVHPEVKIGKHSRITIKTLGIIGEKYVEITPSNEKELVSQGETIEGENPLSIDKIANMGEEIVKNLNQILSDLSKITGEKKFQQNVKSVVEETKMVIAKVDKSFDKIDALVDDLKETNRYFKDIIKRTGPKIEDILQNTNNLIVSGKKEIEETGESIREFLKIKDKTENTLTSFSEASDEFRKTSSEMREFLTKLQNQGLIAKIMKEEEIVDDIKNELTILKETTSKIGKASEKLNDTLSNLNLILEAIKEGEGTVGKLIYRDELYNEIYNFIKDVKENPWRLFFRKK